MREFPDQRDDKADLRAQLVAARSDLVGQLAALEAPATVAGKPGLGPPDNGAIVATLKAQIREIDDALDDLDP